MVTIETVTEKDADALIADYARFLNGGAYIEESIRQAFADGRYYGDKIVADGQTAGYFTFQKGIVFTYPHPVEFAEVEAVAGNRTIDTVDALFVLPEYRRQGFAGRLVEREREELKSRGVELFVVEIWIYPDGSTPAKRIYEKLGRLIFQKAVKDFYKDAGQYQIICPLCGRECRCGSLIEVIEVA